MKGRPIEYIECNGCGSVERIVMAIALSREPHQPQTTTQTQFCCGNIFNCFPFWILCLFVFLGSALDRKQISKKAKKLWSNK